MAENKRAAERLYRGSRTGGFKLAYAPGDEIRDADEPLYTADQLAEASGDEAAVAALAGSEAEATKARATGDTYDQRALKEDLPTEAEQRTQDAARAKRVKAPEIERPVLPTEHLVGEGKAVVVAGSTDDDSGVAEDKSVKRRSTKRAD